MHSVCIFGMWCTQQCWSVEDSLEHNQLNTAARKSCTKDHPESLGGLELPAQAVEYVGLSGFLSPVQSIGSILLRYSLRSVKWYLQVKSTCLCELRLTSEQKFSIRSSVEKMTDLQVLQVVY